MAYPPLLTALYTGTHARRFRCAVGAAGRRLRGELPTLHYFHQVDDPYSHLVLQALPALLDVYAVTAVLHLVKRPVESAAPERALLESWSRRDAAEIAGAYRLTFADPGKPPEPTTQTIALEAMRAAQSGGDMREVLAAWLRISTDLWLGNNQALLAMPRVSAEDLDAAMSKSTARRHQWGHYLGGVIYFEGEWYWGVDRLHHLEMRWQGMGMGRTQQQPKRFPAPTLRLINPGRVATRPILHFFCSLRSPYSYIALARAELLAAHYGAELRLRFVLPMVMRGLPVPKEKRLYITLDVKREAEMLGLPFGRIADPVGAPTERGLAVLHRAIGVGKGADFLRVFMRSIWSEGVDAGKYAGLRRIAECAGLDKDFVDAALTDDSWRSVAQANREEMFLSGLWGVPSFRVNDGAARWGQDRLWLVERDLIEATGAGAER